MRSFIYVIVFLSSQVCAKESRPQNDWSAITTPKVGVVQSIGGYSNGCIIGADTLAERGTGFESIRRFRNRYYGHPELVKLIHWLGKKNEELGRPALLIGDLSQPAGGPMPYGHRSHQLGLDADVWLTHQPKGKRDRDDFFPRFVNLKTEKINQKTWDSSVIPLLKAVAEHPKVERVFVNWIIKRHLCSVVKEDRDWLRRIRPWWGHDRHFHIRIGCQAGSPNCKNQGSVANAPNCGGELWFSDASVIARRKKAAAAAKGKPKQPPKPRAKKVLPQQCQALVHPQRSKKSRPTH